jgi:hypothetical protein
VAPIHHFHLHGGSTGERECVSLLFCILTVVLSSMFFFVLRNFFFIFFEIPFSCFYLFLSSVRLGSPFHENNWA